MTESQLKQVIEFAHQAGQRNAGIDSSPQAARDYYQSLVQDGGLSPVSESETWLCFEAGKNKKRCEKQCTFCGW